MHVRDAILGDAAALEGLVRDLGYDASAADIATRLLTVPASGGRLLVAERGESVVGCRSTSVMQVIHRPKSVGRVSLLVVAEGERGRGVGRLLLTSAEVWLQDAGCGLMEVTSNVALTGAHEFYKACGYLRASFRFARDLSDPRPALST